MKILWTDGSASPNPGPGGFAVIENGQPVVLGREDNSTNIRMEGKAMIAAIKYAGEEGCEIHSDSEFWINTLTKWAPGWKAQGWRKTRGEIKNLEMVQELYGLYQTYPVKLVWVQGHVGTDMNELADSWANKARSGATIESLQQDSLQEELVRQTPLQPEPLQRETLSQEPLSQNSLPPEPVQQRFGF